MCLVCLICQLGAWREALAQFLLEKAEDCEFFFVCVSKYLHIFHSSEQMKGFNAMPPPLKSWGGSMLSSLCVAEIAPPISCPSMPLTQALPWIPVLISMTHCLCTQPLHSLQRVCSPGPSNNHLCRWQVQPGQVIKMHRLVMCTLFCQVKPPARRTPPSLDVFFISAKVLFNDATAVA